MKYRIFNFEQDEKEIFRLSEDQELYHLEHEDDNSIIFKKDDSEIYHLVIYKDSIIFFSRERKEDDGIMKTFVKIVTENNVTYSFTTTD